MLIFTENRNQFNPLMHKISMFAAAAALLASCAPARNAFVINGNIRALPDRVKVGDRFFDGEFRDLDGGTHRLSDYLGKFL